MDLNKSSSVEAIIFTNKVDSIRDTFNSPDKKIIVSHIGKLDQDKINTISTLVETQLEYFGVSKRAIRRVFHIVIETLQNISIHGEIDDNHFQMTYFIVGKSHNDFLIFSGNVVKNGEVAYLNKKLNSIKSLSTLDLKRQYLDVLINGDLSEKGGAGLGFLTILLKSNNSIDFDFEMLNKEYSLFSLQSKVSG